MVARTRAIALLAFVTCSWTARAHEPEEAAPPPPGLTAPVLVERVEPVYPEAARAASVGGVVGLSLDVRADGTVADVKVLRSAGFGLDEAAVAAARRFRFQPALRDGAPTASTVLFDQEFVIRPHLTAQAAAEPQGPLPPVEAQAPPEPGYQSTVLGRGPTLAASAVSVHNFDFDYRPRTSPEDLLRVVPGLLVVQHQGGGKASQLFLRGFDADHGTDVALYLDGVPLNLPSHAHGQGYSDLSFIIPEAIERIDVEKGPYDVRRGDFATAGAIELITRDTFESSSLKYTLNMFPTIDGRAAAGGRFVGIASPTLPGWAAKLHPWIAFEAGYDKGPFAASEQLDRYSVFGKLSYDVTPSLKIGLFVSAYGSGWIGSGQIPARDVVNIGQFGSEDPSEGGLTERQMVTGFLHYKNGANEIDATVYVTRYRLSLFNDFTFFLKDPVNGDEIEQDDTRTVSGGTITWHFHRRWRSISLLTTVGTDFRWDGGHVDRFSAESQNGDFRKRLARLPGTGNDDDFSLVDLAGYVEEVVAFNRFFRLLGGLRADYLGYDLSDAGETLGAGVPNASGSKQFAVFSPKAAAIVTPIRDRLELYLDFGMGFHSNMAQVALRDGATQTNADGSTFVVHGVPRLYGGEVGARTHLWNRVDALAAVWVSWLENETVFDADQASFVPSAPTRRWGVDFEVRARILPWLFADFDLAQAEATAVPSGGNGGAVALAPRFYATGGLTVKHPVGVRAALRFRALGARPAFDEASPEYQYFTSKTLANGQANPDYDPSRVTAQGWFVLDAYVAYRWRFLEAMASVQNLANTQWSEAQFGNRSCTKDETYNPANPNYAGSGNLLSDGSFVDRCGVVYGAARSGVPDVHFTPGVPFNLQLTLKAYF
jgi:TonB family protein